MRTRPSCLSSFAWAALICLFSLFAAGSVAAQEAGEEQGQKEELKATIRQIVVEGNTILSEQEVQEFAAQYEGRTMSIDDMKAAAADLQKRYHALGYKTVLVVVPPQKIVEEVGILRLRVAEGRVGEILIEGSKYFAAKRHYLPYLPSKGELFNWDDLQAGLNFINAHPDKSATAVLKPGKEAGTTDVHLIVQETHPFHFAIRYDNTGSENTPRSRAYASLQYDDFFGLGQIGLVQMGIAPADWDKVRQYAASYYVPLGPLGGPLGHSVTLYGGFSESSSETIMDVFSLFGKGSIVGAQYRMPLPEIFSFKEELALGAEYQKIKDVIVFGATTLQKNEVRTLPVYFRWTAGRTHNDGQTTVSVGARYQKDQQWYDFKESKYRVARADVDTDFLVWKLGAQRTQHIGKGWTASLSAQAQLSNNRLLPSEEFGLGGYDTVRGYRRRILVGDEGFNVRSELRTPVLPQFLPDVCNEQVQLLAFADYGWANIKDAQPNEYDEEEMLGAGVGMRIGMFDSHLTGRLDVGYALQDLSNTPKNEVGEYEVHIGVEYRF